MGEKNEQLSLGSGPEDGGFGDCGHGVAEGLPEAAFAGALACLPGAGPGTLATIVGRYGPRRAWALVVSGRLRRPPSGPRAKRLPTGSDHEWEEWAMRFDVDAFWRRCESSGIQVTWLGGPGYPQALTRVSAPAGVLFVAGDLGALNVRPAVAIIGSRQCSQEGAAVAFDLGYELSRSGVCVVSGLAAGIDGAAHAGAVTALRGKAGKVTPEGQPDEDEAAPALSPAAPTVGIAASGVDVVYPPKHGGLWREVIRWGAVVSETPPGHPAQSWRFPSRNRLIAGLSKLVVVVECHIQSGSWHTVDAATRDQIDVAVVPGSVRNPAAAGSNQMLCQGVMPVRHAQDILDLIHHPAPGSLSLSETTGEAGGRAGCDHDRAKRLGPVEEEVYRVLCARPLALDDLVERSRLPLTAVAVALERLVGEDLAREEAGWWTRR